jgi:N4-gp56 family major capsid protein
MPNMNTTRTQIPAEVNNFYDRTLLERAMPLLTHLRWAQIRDLPRNVGTKVIKFRRYGALSAATTPLTEGVTPTGSQLSVTDITATVAQYGDYITLTDVVSYESKDATLMETAELLGEQNGLTLDELCRDILNACTGVVYSGTGNTATADVAAGDVISLANLDSAIATLKDNKAKKITRQVNASSGYATSPIKAAFIGIVSPAVGVKIRTLAVAASQWTPVEKYASQSGVIEGEIGTYEEIRFVETTEAKVKTGEGTGSIDVYCTLVFGANAYGITRVSGEALKNIVKPLGSAGSADPLDQRATSGWKATFVAKILNENFIQRIESAKV